MTAPVLTAAGLTIQTFDEALQQIAADVRNALGQQIAADSPTSVVGIIDGIVAQLSTLCQEAIQGVYLNGTLDGAAGTSLDRLVALGGIYRKAATQSRVTIRCTNSSGAPVNVQSGALFQIDNTAYQFVMPALFTVPASSYVDVSCLAVETGPVPVSSGQSWVWVSAFTGSTSIALTNPTSGTEGTLVEDDAALKLRFVQSFSLPGSGTLNAIRAAVLSIVDVQEVAAFENDGDTPGIVAPVTIAAIPPHSFTTAVKGTATGQSIAQVIFARKPVGIRAWGNQTETVTDSQGYPHVIQYQAATQTTVYVTVQVAPASLSVLHDAIQAAIIAYINGSASVAGLTIAQPVLYNRIYAIVSDTCKANGTPATDIVLTQGTAPSPGGTSNIIIAWDHYAHTDAAKVVVTAV